MIHCNSLGRQHFQLLRWSLAPNSTHLLSKTLALLQAFMMLLSMPSGRLCPTVHKITIRVGPRALHQDGVATCQGFHRQEILLPLQLIMKRLSILKCCLCPHLWRLGSQVQFISPNSGESWEGEFEDLKTFCITRYSRDVRTDK